MAHPTKWHSPSQTKSIQQYIQAQHSIFGSSFSPRRSEQMAASSVLAFNSTAKWKAHFDAIKETNKLMVIDFTSTWCGPCKSMDPVIKDFAAKYTDAEFIKIDVDELMGVSQEFQVQAMPTFILIKKGKVADKVTGARKEELQKLIEKHSRN